MSPAESRCRPSRLRRFSWHQHQAGISVMETSRSNSPPATALVPAGFFRAGQLEHAGFARELRKDEDMRRPCLSPSTSPSRSPRLRLRSHFFRALCAMGAAGRVAQLFRIRHSAVNPRADTHERLAGSRPRCFSHWLHQLPTVLHCAELLDERSRCRAIKWSVLQPGSTDVRTVSGFTSRSLVLS